MDKLLGALVLILLVTGFLTNSVAMRFTGVIDGNIVFPSILLVASAALAAVIIAKIKQLSH